MLKGISRYLSPDLLAILYRMGHGDEIVLADAHFPGHSLAQQVIRADGVSVLQLLEGIMPLFELDTYEAPLIMMDCADKDKLNPSVEQDYMRVIRQNISAAKSPLRLERFAFYERARKAYAIVITGELRKFGNLILKKGVTP